MIPGGGDVPVLPSLPPVVQPDPSPESPRAIPADGTVTYGPGEVVAILPPGGGVVINIPSGRPKPVIGGHVAVAPTENLPDGMFAKVEAVTNTAQGTLVELISAPVDEVFSEINIADQSTEPPQVVDEAGRPVVASVSRANGVTAMATPASAWSCKKDGILGGVTSFWDASGDPITIRFENTRVFHHFSAGLFKSPYLLLQFSGEAVVDIGYSAKLAGFSCELTPTFRRNHRLRISLPSVGGVPVSFNLEPALKFDVNVEGRLAVSQRHFFGVTLEQDGLSAPSFRLAKSANPPTFDMAFSGSVSLFAGGDLSFMFGGGYGTANAQAGVFGAFGPELKIEQTAAKKECIEANLRFIADLGVRLELWSKRWSPTVAKLTSSPARIYGPWCPPGGVGPGSGGTTPTTPTVPGTTPGGPPPATSATLRLPRISGPSGQHFTPTGTCPIALMRPGADDLVVLEYLDGQLRGFSFGWETDESDGSFYNRTYVMGAVGPHTLQVRCTTLIPGTNTVDTVNTFATSEPVTFTVDRPTGGLLSVWLTSHAPGPAGREGCPHAQEVPCRVQA